jgi:hypothetical protein
MPNEIDVASLTTCRVAAGGSYVYLNFEDALGRPRSLRSTSAGFQQRLMALPRLLSRALLAQHRDSSVRAVFPVSEWRPRRGGRIAGLHPDNGDRGWS